MEAIKPRQLWLGNHPLPPKPTPLAQEARLRSEILLCPRGKKKCSKLILVRYLNGNINTAGADKNVTPADRPVWFVDEHTRRLGARCSRVLWVWVWTTRKQRNANRNMKEVQGGMGVNTSHNIPAAGFSDWSVRFHHLACCSRSSLQVLVS